MFAEKIIEQSYRCLIKGISIKKRYRSEVSRGEHTSAEAPMQMRPRGTQHERYSPSGPKTRDDFTRNSLRGASVTLAADFRRFFETRLESVCIRSYRRELLSSNRRFPRARSFRGNSTRCVNISVSFYASPDRSEKIDRGRGHVRTGRREREASPECLRRSSRARRLWQQTHSLGRELG